MVKPQPAQAMAGLVRQALRASRRGISACESAKWRETRGAIDQNGKTTGADLQKEESTTKLSHSSLLVWRALRTQTWEFTRSSCLGQRLLFAPMAALVSSS